MACIVPEVILASSYEATPEGLVLLCESRGSPSTATLWFKDDIFIPDTDDLFTIPAALSSSKSDSRGSRGKVYRHSLEVFEGDVGGVYSCDVSSKWVMADRSSSGRTSKLLKRNAITMLASIVLSY